MGSGDGKGRAPAERLRFALEHVSWKHISFVLACVVVLLTLHTLALPSHGSRSTTASNLNGDGDVLLIIFGTTMFPNATGVRFEEALESVKNAKNEGWITVICDSSPDPEVRVRLKLAGASVFAQHKAGRKGQGLREALQAALDVVPPTATDAIFAYQEIEKSNMPFHWAEVKDKMIQTGADIAVPWREESLFQATYPVAQYHSETFGRIYLNTLARKKIKMVGKSLANPSARERTWEDLDWHFGPFAFRQEWSEFWLQHDGQMWDAQILPMVYAIRSGAVPISVEIPFRASPHMKREEDNNLFFTTKRKSQLEKLLDKVEESLVNPIPDYTHAVRTTIGDAAKLLA
uniref:Uncharacterized protein n=1 Tax=Lotharella oceanica TaxID=641309 RepID=A0A7S2X640_9EUKA|mmetsp:Transcript_13026/g.24934  ORF Transcript_13026/g.24934 Transcript_13026/m.24934 type:complete len:347 (+) Transcript_13026:43-1083(+)